MTRFPNYVPVTSAGIKPRRAGLALAPLNRVPLSNMTARLKSQNMIYDAPMGTQRRDWSLKARKDGGKSPISRA